MNVVFLLGVLLSMFVVGGFAAWRIHRLVSWSALLMTAQATGSFVECVAFIRYCQREVGR